MMFVKNYIFKVRTLEMLLWAAAHPAHTLEPPLYPLLIVDGRHKIKYKSTNCYKINLFYIVFTRKKKKCLLCDVLSDF